MGHQPLVTFVRGNSKPCSEAKCTFCLFAKIVALFLCGTSLYIISTNDVLMLFPFSRSTSVKMSKIEGHVLHAVMQHVEGNGHLHCRLCNQLGHCGQSPFLFGGPIIGALPVVLSDSRIFGPTEGNNNNNK